MKKIVAFLLLIGIFGTFTGCEKTPYKHPLHRGD
ncbi:MAG: hypothetical protein QG567_1647 [Campylobacterota bacterium]|nr:hypothetical protein [Campylobacterota bacterium]